MMGAAASGCIAPVPLSGTKIGEPGALAQSNSAALRLPVAEAPNVTVMVQLAVGASDAPEQVPEISKSAGFTPASVIAPIRKGPAPSLLIVTVSFPSAVRLTLGGSTVRAGTLPPTAAKL